MGPRIKKLYNRAKKDEKFKAALLSADGDKFPGLFDNEVDKIAVAGFYYGWLIAKHGDDWDII